METYMEEEENIKREIYEELVKMLQYWNRAYKYLWLFTHYQPAS
jgi:hypothetical protein